MKVVELLVLLIDCSSCADVDEKGGKDDDPKLVSIKLIPLPVFKALQVNSPDRAIKCCNTENVPLGGDPAPQGGIAICAVALVVLEEDVYKSRNKGNAVAA